MSGDNPWWSGDELEDLYEATPERVAEWELIVEAFAGTTKMGWNRTACTICLTNDGKKDQKKSLNYNVRTGGYMCQRCGVHGSLPQNYRNKIYEEDPTDMRVREERAKLPPSVPAEAGGYVPLFEEPGVGSMVFDWARNYLLDPKPKGRGLNPQSCFEAGIGAALEGKLAGRIIVPIPDYDDPDKPWRGWVSRDTTGRSERPYIYPKGMNRIGLLYNAPALSVYTDTPCFVVEGTLDAIYLWPDAVAVLGKPLESQIELLAKAARPLVVCLDGDAAKDLGLSLTWTLKHIAPGLEVENMRLGPKLDPDDIPLDEIRGDAWRMIHG